MRLLVLLCVLWAAVGDLRHHRDSWQRARMEDMDPHFKERVHFRERTHANVAVSANMGTNMGVGMDSNEVMDLNTASREWLLERVRVLEDELTEGLENGGEEPPPASKVGQLSTTDQQRVTAFISANANTDDMAVTVPTTSFLQVDESAAVSAHVSARLSDDKNLIDVFQHALSRSPATGPNSKPQYAVVYAFDGSTWWYWTETFTPSLSGITHAEVKAKNANLFLKGYMPKNTLEIVLFSYYSPCTTSHNGGKSKSCRELVIDHFLQTNPTIGFTVMFYEWYLNGQTSGTPDQKRQAELGAYMTSDISKAAKEGRFQLVAANSVNVKHFVP